MKYYFKSFYILKYFLMILINVGLVVWLGRQPPKV